MVNEKLKNILYEIGFKQIEDKLIENNNFHYQKFFYKEYIFLITIDKDKTGKLFLGKPNKKYLFSYQYDTINESCEGNVNLMIKDLKNIFYKELRKWKIENILNESF